MSENQRPNHDPLEEAIEAFQQMTVPDQPPDAEMLAQLATRQGESPRPVSISSSKRRYLMRILVPSAAAALVLLGGLGWFFLNATRSVAVADVIKAAEEHKLVRYKLKHTVTKDGIVATADGTVYADLKALRIRTEMRHKFMDPDDREKYIEEIIVSVQDTPNGRLLKTNTHPGGKVLPPRKDGALFRIGEEREKWKSFLENLRDFQQKEGVTSGKDALGGREMIKFQFVKGIQTETLWVDAKTKLPVRSELEYSSSTASEKFVFSDHEWDPELPKGFKSLDELFSTEPPEGYTIDDKPSKGYYIDDLQERAKENK